jgi:hypothetical protein
MHMRPPFIQQAYRTVAAVDSASQRKWRRMRPTDQTCDIHHSIFLFNIMVHLFLLSKFSCLLLGRTYDALFGSSYWNEI